MIANNGNVGHDDENNFYHDDGELPKANNMFIMLLMHLHAYSEFSQKLQLEREQIFAPSLQVSKGVQISMGESVETFINQVVILQEIVNDWSLKIQ